MEIRESAACPGSLVNSREPGTFATAWGLKPGTPLLSASDAAQKVAADEKMAHSSAAAGRALAAQYAAGS